MSKEMSNELCDEVSMEVNGLITTLVEKHGLCDGEIAAVFSAHVVKHFFLSGFSLIEFDDAMKKVRSAYKEVLEGN
jgi:hypothetical protein